MKRDDYKQLPIDEQFVILLHKKLMDKKGSNKRRLKKYYIDQYKKTGKIPGPLLLAEKGIIEGRKCSGRSRVISSKIKSRFIRMVKASSDVDDDSFIFLTKAGRTIKNYNYWLEQEFNQKISLTALRRLVKEENLKIYLEKPDFDDEEQTPSFSFKQEDIFDLIQVDGCKFHYFKIRGEDHNKWQKAQVIEFYDTGSRYMFTLDACFSESSENSINIFSQFLLSTVFPDKTIRFRPDNAKGFLNLKRPINELNIKYSLPKGFYLKPDFSRINAPKDKAHLESSHRSLHHFEMQIIKHFENRINKTEPGYLFKNSKKEKIMITYLDITIEQLRESGLLESYRQNHNNQKHYFSENGTISAWIPLDKFEKGLFKSQLITFTQNDVQDFMKYGFNKIKATVSKKVDIIFNNKSYYVAVGFENFSKHKSTKVYISDLKDKLLIFEYKDNGILLGEALLKQPFEKTKTKMPLIKANEVEIIIEYLETKKMTIDNPALIKIHHQGLNLETTQKIYTENQNRYKNYLNKLRQPEIITGKALFNAFILDCLRYLSKKNKNYYK